MRQLLAYIIVVVVSVSSSVIASNRSIDSVRKLERSTEAKVSTALTLVNKQRIAALKVVCIRDAATSASSIAVRKNQAANDKKVSQDKSLSAKTKKARAGQSAVESQSVKDLQRLKCKVASTDAP
jgi:hypothetical protein